MNIVRIIYLVFSISAISFGGIDFSVTANKTAVTVGEQIIVTAKAVCTGKVKNISAPTLPPSDNFTLLNTSQNQTQSSSIQIINGRMTQTNEITYLYYYFIAPKREGSFQFPSLTLTADGQTYSSQPFTISVTKQPVESPDFRVTLRMSKNRLYVGEQAVLVLEAAQKPNAPVEPTNQGFSAAITAIDQAGGKDFSLSHLFSDKISREQKNIGGETYIVYPLQFSLIPIKEGTFTIGPVAFEYERLSRMIQRDPFDGFFGGFFGGGIQREPRIAYSNQLTIHALPLPPAPRGFSGAVGSFTLSASAEPRELPAGEAATLTVTLRASTRPGNVPAIMLPPLDDFEVFTPEENTAVDTTNQGIRTRKTFKYLIIPKEEGQREIPAISFIYFDPSAGRYSTVSTEPIRFTVTRGKKVTRDQRRYLTQEEIRQVGSDIRYIKTPSRLRHQSARPYRNPLFLIVYIMPFIAAVFSLLYKLQAQRTEADAAKILRGRAYRTASKQLERLAKETPQPAAAEAASRLYDILEQYITHRFGFAAAGATLDELRGLFAGRLGDPALAGAVVSMLEELDTIRFSPSVSGRFALLEYIGRTRQILSAMEKKSKGGA